MTEKQSHHRPSNLKKGILAGTLAFGAFFSGDIVGAVNSNLRQEAIEESDRVIGDCRDRVLCALSIINKANIKSIPETVNRQSFKPLDKVKLGECEYTIGLNPYGYVVVTNDVQYLVEPAAEGQDSNTVVAKLKDQLKQIQDGRFALNDFIKPNRDRTEVNP
jgi:hypothetical protein